MLDVFCIWPILGAVGSHHAASTDQVQALIHTERLGFDLRTWDSFVRQQCSQNM